MILMMTCHLKKAWHLCFRVGTVIMICTHMRQSINSYITLVIVGDNRAHLTLTAAHGATWLEFTQKAAREALKKMKMRIPGGNMLNKLVLAVYAELGGIFF